MIEAQYKRRVEHDRATNGAAVLGDSCPPWVAPNGAGKLLSHQAVQVVADRAARFQISVLVLGDTGVGKEVLARRIHSQSARAEHPLVVVDCASLCASLAEGELFGHERGAFTGAAAQGKPGLLEVAHGGTVFLDEVGELPLPVQMKLLRALDAKTVQRVGSTKPRAVDVRFLAATNRNLDQEVLEGRFRSDLLFRLDGIRLMIPPLRDHAEDIPCLARQFLMEATRRESVSASQISDEALEELQRYRWPGNVRELRNVIDRALVLCDGGPIEPRHLIFSGAPPPPTPQQEVRLPHANPVAFPPMQRIASLLPAVRREIIVAALASFAGNQSRAAKALRISRRTLVKHLDVLRIPRPRKALDHDTTAAVQLPPLVSNDLPGARSIQSAATWSESTST